MNQRARFHPLTGDEVPEEITQQFKNITLSERDLLVVFKEGGGTLNIDEILKGFFLVHEKNMTRSTIVNLLMRMKRKRHIFPTGIKGEYSIHDPESEMLDSNTWLDSPDEPNVPDESLSSPKSGDEVLSASEIT